PAHPPLTLRLVGRLTRTRAPRHDRLQHRQSPARLRRIEYAVPLPTLADRALAAVVLDERHGHIPVLPRVVVGREVLVLAELLHQLLAVRDKLRERLRRALDAGPLVEVRPVNHGPRPRVVRDAVQLAVVLARSRQPLEP